MKEEKNNNLCVDCKNGTFGLKDNWYCKIRPTIMMSTCCKDYIPTHADSRCKKESSTLKGESQATESRHETSTHAVSLPFFDSDVLRNSEKTSKKELHEPLWTAGNIFFDVATYRMEHTREFIDADALEVLRKKVQWWLQRFVKKEYTIYQVKRHINDEFIRLGLSKEGKRE